MQATDGDEVLFAIELVYAGIFRLTNIPPDTVQPLIMIECPRLLFPFARQIIADASRNGGFPPLLIDPVDFVSLYRQRLADMQTQRSATSSPDRAGGRSPAQIAKPAWPAEVAERGRRPRTDMADHLGGGEIAERAAEA